MGTLLFQWTRTTKSYEVYQQVGGINRLYLPLGVKPLDPSVAITVTVQI